MAAVCDPIGGNVSHWVSKIPSVVPHFQWPHGLYSLWNSPGQYTGVGSPFPSLRDLPQPRAQTQVYHIAGRFFTIWAIREATSHCQSQGECLRQQIKHSYGPDSKGGNCHKAVGRYRLLPTPWWEHKQLSSSKRPKNQNQFLWETAQPSSDFNNILWVSTAAGTPW